MVDSSRAPRFSLRLLLELASRFLIIAVGLVKKWSEGDCASLYVQFKGSRLISWGRREVGRAVLFGACIGMG